MFLLLGYVYLLIIHFLLEDYHHMLLPHKSIDDILLNYMTNYQIGKIIKEG